ncbi:MAG: hypothetical protein JW801_14975 [Bacteroidales bacterium]|nr:hypothetical protein [Bacteroidales bacterium]
MNKIKYFLLITSGVVLSLGWLSSCEIDEPFSDPEGSSFVIKGVNPETNYYEELEEPYTLIVGQTYDFVVDGAAEQFVFWFGVPGDSSKNTPSGSDFEDRGVNHLSKGVATVNGLTRYSYKTAGEYTLTFVASSYSYTRDEYTENLITKTIEVVP